MNASAIISGSNPEQASGSKPGEIGEKQSSSQDHNDVQEQKWGLRNILVPINFSHLSRNALKYAAAIDRQNGAKIILLHVFEPSTVYPDFSYSVKTSDDLQPTEQAIHKLCDEQNVDTNLISKTLIRSGTPHQEIIEVACEEEADLIVLATHGYTGIAHLLIGSTSERVIRLAPCPVLIVREKEREFVRD